MSGLSQSLVGWVGSGPADLSKKNRKTTLQGFAGEWKPCEAIRVFSNITMRSANSPTLSGQHVQTGYLQNCLLQSKSYKSPTSVHASRDPWTSVLQGHTPNLVYSKACQCLQQHTFFLVPINRTTYLFLGKVLTFSDHLADQASKQHINRYQNAVFLLSKHSAESTSTAVYPDSIYRFIMCGP